MENNKALVWIRDDFRVNHNSALAYASENHEQVSTVYIFNPEDYENKREAQRCLLYTSPSPRDLSTSRMPSSA